MDPIKLIENERKKVLSYNPSDNKFLYINDIQEGRVFLPRDLDEESQRLLVIKRLQMEEPHIIEELGGLNKEQQIEEVCKSTEKGKEIVQAWINNLQGTIEDIKKGYLI